MFNQLLALSPAYIAHQKIAAAAMSQVYTAAMAAQFLARHSPNYFGTQFNGIIIFKYFLINKIIEI
jgi:hypothetical protein